jgi:glycosyltransferase involved in cell wall biosynthesis
MRIALVNAWYIAAGGAELVDDVLGQVFPEADVFNLFNREAAIPPSLRSRSIRTSFLHKIPTITKSYRLFMPLCPYAIESLDLRGYDLIISSEHGAAKGVLCDQGAIHLCYCHSPWRQLYDLYWKSLEIVPWLLRPAYALVCHRLRQWDYVAAQRVDHFVANSRHIQHRILKCYRRDSEVIYPPVNTDKGFISERHDDYYLSVGRLTHTKRLDVVVEACNRLGRRLLVAGEGRDEGRLKAMAGPTIEFLGRVSDDQLRSLYANCRAFLFSADEDFGITPVEAQSYGRPVIAYGHGGALETLLVGDHEPGADTGVFFPHQTPDSAVDGILRFESREGSFIPEVIRSRSRMFDTSVFVESMRECVARQVEGR